MRTPSIKSLRAITDNPRRIKAILQMSRAELEELPAGAARVRECYSRPATFDLRMHCLDAELPGMFGLEFITLRNGEEIAYLNAGDTYTPTLLKWRGNYYVRDWGSIVERYGSMD